MKNQKGFIQIPILIAIITGILVLGGTGYFGFKQYQNYQVEKLKEERMVQEKEKETKVAAETQQKALEQAQAEIEKLKQESEQAKQKQSVIEQKLSQSNSNSKDLTIQSSELTPYLTGVGEVICGKVSGSGSLWQFNSGYSVLTNYHVIRGATSCIFVISDAPNDIKHSGVYKLNIANISSWNNSTDVAVLQLGSPTDAYFPSTSGLNYKISALPKCPTKTEIGSSMIIVGFPAYAQQTLDVGGSTGNQTFRTATNGIISAHDTSVEYSKGLPYPNYFVSAKIDSGNSGGIAFSKTSNGLCVLGIPTWLTVGNYETQGLIQNIHNVMYKN